jgi:hypothetical protein
MECKCGNSIIHIQEHLEKEANWICSDCATRPPVVVLPTDAPSPRDSFKWPICPTCHKRPRTKGQSYCAVCAKVYNHAREFARKAGEAK